ncbi:MAG: LptA/OstA family protein [Pseudomonadota bacterium]
MKKHSSVRTASLVSAALLLFSPAAAQLGPDSDAPIDISGDAAEFQEETAVWSGNVRVVQDNVILAADRLEAELNEDGDFTTVTAIGQVRYSNGKEVITGKRAIFDNDARTITVIDDVVVTQGRQVMKAGAVIYWIDTGRVRFTPAPGQRIRGIFFTDNAEQT